VGHHNQPILSPVDRELAVSHSIAEAPFGLSDATASGEESVLREVSDGKRKGARRTLRKCAIGKVELDRLLLDAVRRTLEADHPPATNDNQLSWPLLAFAEGWYGSA
jgi:hypothetical protein